MPATAKQIHRLSEFVIEEVSMVDRAANKRRFLQFKRDDSEDDMTTKTIQPDGKGTFTTKDDEGGKDKPQVVKGMESVEQIFYKVGDAVDRLMRVASVTLQADALKLEDAPNAATVVAEIEAVKAVLSEVAAEIADTKKAIEAAPAADETAKAAPTAEESKDPVESLEEFAVMLRKAGAPMNAGRLKRFTNALSELASILREVGGDTKTLTDKGKKKGKTAKADDATEPTPTPTPTPTAKADDDDEAAKLRKKLAAAEREIAVLKREPAAPTSLAVDSHDDQPKDDSDFAWPSDMNQPLGPDDVEPAHSFY